MELARNYRRPVTMALCAVIGYGIIVGFGEDGREYTASPREEPIEFVTAVGESLRDIRTELKDVYKPAYSVVSHDANGRYLELFDTNGESIRNLVISRSATGEVQAVEYH